MLRVVVGLDDTRSLPTIVVVARDVLTFAVVLLGAQVVDNLLERVRGPNEVFAFIRSFANVLLGFLALVFLAEAALFVLIDVCQAVWSRWSDRSVTTASHNSEDR